MSRIYHSILLIWIGMFVGCKKPQPNFNLTSCLAGKYTPKQLDFFYKVGFKNYRSVKKWNEGITISFKNICTQNDSLNLAIIVTELRPLLYPLAITCVTGIGKIQITIDSISPGKSAHDYGMTTTYFMGEHIERVEMWLDSRQTKVNRKQTLRHEMMHALGFVHPTTYDSNENSQIGYFTFNNIDQYKSRDSLIDGYTSLDKIVIEILYQECLPSGLSRTEFETQLYQLKIKPPEGRVK